MVSHPAPAQVSPVDIARDLGAALFREGKYPAVREVFLILVRNYQDDARLWYFAALANGLTSGDWAGESDGLVRRGIACEQRGMPKCPDIDAQFSTLTKEQGKDWLEGCAMRVAVARAYRLTGHHDQDGGGHQEREGHARDQEKRNPDGQTAGGVAGREPGIGSAARPRHGHVRRAAARGLAIGERSDASGANSAISGREPRSILARSKIRSSGLR